MGVGNSEIVHKNKSSWLRQICLIVVLGWVTFLFVLPSRAAAQGNSVPENGDFSSGRTGWAFTGGQGAHCGVSNSIGHTLPGALLWGAAGCDALSMTFSSSASSVLTFWAYGDNGGTMRVHVRSFVDQSDTYADFNFSSSWAEYTMNVGSCSICQIATQPIEYNNAYFDDMSINNAIPVSARTPKGTNGKFLGAFGWTGNNYRSDIGNAELGSIHYWDNGAIFYNLPHVTDRGIWTFTGRCSDWACGAPGQQILGYIDYDSSYGLVQLTATGVVLTTADWQSFTANFAGVAPGDRISIFVQGWYSLLDDVCPPSGCTMGTPTPTATSASTATPGGGGGFPTQIPYPTFPAWPTVPPYLTQVPYPTQQAYPTPIYGPGTSQPVIITGGSPIPVYLVTPLPTPVPQFTQIPFPTRLPTWTPIPTKTPEPTLWTFGPTTIAMGSSSASNLNLGGSLSSKGIPDFNTGTTTAPVLFETTRIVMGPIPFRLNTVNMPTLNITLNYTYISTFSFLGIPMLSAISGIGACWLAVFIFKRLRQQR